ncbi:MAG: family 43 glycosylhydrolase [Acutalibacteraceae bacterium]|jgi:xylan 1,4-beta-xylosidase
MNRRRTVCNPINISYQYQAEYRSRESADPAVAVYKGEYYLFASHGSGYWVSSDLANWEFLRVDTDKHPEFKRFAPGPCVVGDTMYLTHSEGGSILKSDTPRDPDSWVDIGKPYGWGDPAFFVDDDGYVYIYEGLSDKDPIHVAKLDPSDNMRLVEGPVDIAMSDIAHRGFERSGDDNQNERRRPYFEGAWMHKYGGKYYLTYAAPGTEFATYADGCFIADSPMGPFTYCENSPVVWKATGFMRGAGHGCVFEDLGGHWWKMDTVSISVNHMFERRLALFPVRFAADGRMYTDTLRGDYPMYIPAENPDSFGHPGPDWHLLSYGKAVTASSALADHPAALAADENMKTWWSAQTGGSGEWLQMDLGDGYAVWAVQVNFADQDADAVGGRDNGFQYRYRLLGSADGGDWTVLADCTGDHPDTSHDYFEWEEPLALRYLRLENAGSVPAGGKFAVSGLRVFGNGNTRPPQAAPILRVTRGEDERDMRVCWDAVPDAQGYFLRFGVDPDALYTHYQVIGDTEAAVGCLNTGVTYYVTADAYNESGVTRGTTVWTV